MSDVNEGHGPDCACGCHDSDSHSHEHHHDHEHHHGHDGHDHAPAVNDNFETDSAFISLEAHTHEQAATVSMDIRPKAGKAIVFSDLVDAMKAIAVEAEAAGGVVGHIKAYARDGAAFAHASVTAPDLPPAYEGDAQASFGENSAIQLVSIVLLVGQDDLASICRNKAAPFE